MHTISPVAVTGLGDVSAHVLPFPPTDTLTAAAVLSHHVQLLPSSLSVSVFHLREVPAQRRDEVDQMGGRKQAL